MFHGNLRIKRRMAFVVIVLVVGLLAGRVDARRPNVVFIMSDELGYYELSCMAHPNFQTPNIDKLAAGGVRFTQALAGSSVCAPTRGCLLTGKHSGHTSVRSNGGGTPLRAGEPTIASVLKKQGYATGGFGKWGCGGRGSTGVPEDHGFDMFLGYYDQVHAHSYYPPYIVRNSQEVPLTGNHGGGSGETYSHYVIFDEAKKFIRDNKDQPFFCYLPITPPHGLFSIPDSDPSWALYKDKPWPESAKRYAAMVNMVDRQVGEVVSLLKELDLEKDTIIFFCGDNGGMDYFKSKDRPRGFHGPNVDPKTGVAFRGQKGNLYEGGLRIPMIVNWPGKIQGGRVSDLLWYFPDVMPTVAELAGAETPDDIDGLSIVPELLGENTVGRKQPQHQYLYWEIGRQTAVRMGSWKAIRPNPASDWQLYDLSKDITEQDDVAGDQPEVLARMKAYALAAHEPVREGVFHDRTLHEKDRRAKFGDRQPPSRDRSGGKANMMPTQGLVPREKVRLVRVSSEVKDNRKLAASAFDGNPRTHWHTQFSPTLDKHPHELVLDLGTEYTVSGIRYLARQDRGWNGAFKQCEIYVSNDPVKFDNPTGKGEFEKVKNPQEIDCTPTKGRYVLIKVLSEINGGAWASASEIGVVGR